MFFMINIFLYIVLGIRHQQKLLNTKSFKKYGVQNTKDGPNPGCNQYRYDSEEYWACFIQHELLTNYHPVGTCKMGPKSDQTTVVDPQLR